MGHLAEAKALLAQGQAEEEQARVKLEMKQRELEFLRKRVKDLAREAGENKKKLDQMRSVVERQRQQLATCKWDKDKEEELEARLKHLKKSVGELTEVILSFICLCEGVTYDGDFANREASISGMASAASTLNIRTLIMVSIDPKSEGLLHRLHTWIK